MNTEPSMPSGWFEPLEPAIRRAFLAEAARSRLLEIEAERAAPRPSPWRLYVGIGCCIVLPLIALGIGLLISHGVSSRAASRRRAALLDPQSIANGRVRMAAPLMFNSIFMRGGAPEGAGLVLIVDDDGPALTVDEELDLMTRISFADAKSKDPVVRGFAALMADERYVAQRRTRIDPAVTNGRVIYAAHLIARRAELVADLNAIPMIPCFVGRGPMAVTRVVPADIVAAVSRAFPEVERQSEAGRGPGPESVA